MDIKLKKIKIADHLSEETIAFTADLYIDGRKTGTCLNDGHGGATLYRGDSWEDQKVIERAETYCASLPKMPIKHNGDVFMIDSTLENTISTLIHEYATNADIQKFHRQMERDMKKSILIGTDERYSVYNPNRPLDQVIASSTNPVASINEILSQLRKFMKPGERILNTNFPAGVIIPEPVNA